jgi:2-polyprenyl-3-methyl-5-hydroxy-6-metoxy-1,4-benzoquinol methylase
MTDSAYLRYGRHERPELMPFIPETAHSLLDVGCGAGEFGRCLRRLRPKMELWAVEPDPMSAQIAKDAFDQVIVSNFPNSSIPDGRFDVVLCADVLEHMAEPEKALLAAAAALTEQGIMLASIPNVRNWRKVVWPLVKHGNWSYTETGILDRTHLRFFTRRSIIDFFDTNNWVVESMQGIKSSSRRDKLMSAMTVHRFDDFIFSQYIAVARPIRERGQ